MKRITNTLLCAAISIAAGSAMADTYDPATNQLTIDSVQVGSTIYSGVVITVGKLISLGSQRPAPPTVAAHCTSANLTLAAVNKVKVGMTVDQVNSVFGCAFDGTATLRSSVVNLRSWDNAYAYANGNDTLPMINVTIGFDPATETVQASSGGRPDVTASGL